MNHAGTHRYLPWRLCVSMFSVRPSRVPFGTCLDSVVVSVSSADFQVQGEEKQSRFNVSVFVAEQIKSGCQQLSPHSENPSLTRHPAGPTG